MDVCQIPVTACMGSVYFVSRSIRNYSNLDLPVTHLPFKTANERVLYALNVKKNGNPCIPHGQDTLITTVCKY